MAKEFKWEESSFKKERKKWTKGCQQRKPQLTAKKSCCCILLFLILLAAGCKKSRDSQADSSNWRTWRIGTPLAWSADYYLTIHEDLPHLYRYSGGSECLMALQFGYVDAMVVDQPYAMEIVRLNEGMKLLEETVAPDQLIALVYNGRPELLEEMNAYVPAFRESERFHSLTERIKEYEFVPDTTIPELTEGELLRVAIDTSSGSYPYTYYDFVTEKPQGVDVEFIKSFAAEHGYRVEWVDSSWDDSVLAVTSGRVDIFVCANSIYHKGELEANGKVLCSDPYFDFELSLVVYEGK